MNYIQEDATFLKNECGGRPIIGFDTNPLYCGNKLLRPFYQHILNRQTLTLDCVCVNGTRFQADVWPYYLQKSGHSWFLIAANAKSGQYDSYGLDGILEIRTCSIPYKDCNQSDLDQFLSQRVGATSSQTYRDPTTITFQVNAETRQFLENSPMHPSQHITQTLADGSVIMKMTVVYTREMLHTLCKYCEGITVLSPIDLRYSVARYHAEALENYGYPVDYELFENTLIDKPTPAQSCR